MSFKDTDSPDDLRDLAKRTRHIAAGLDEAERQRLMEYADELERLARELESRC